jgi:hypothetical protein
VCNWWARDGRRALGRHWGKRCANSPNNTGEAGPAFSESPCLPRTRVACNAAKCRVGKQWSTTPSQDKLTKSLGSSFGNLGGTPAHLISLFRSFFAQEDPAGGNSRRDLNLGGLAAPVAQHALVLSHAFLVVISKQMVPLLPVECAIL